MYIDEDGKRRCTLEERAQRSRTLKGHTISAETRRKMSKAKKGKAPWNKGKKGCQDAWNKGKTKEDYPQLVVTEERKMKMRILSKGRKHTEASRAKMRDACKNRTPMSQEIKDKISISVKKNPNRYWLGKKRSEETIKKIQATRRKNGVIISEETRRKISISLKGHKGYWLGKHCSEETKKKLSEKQKGEKGSNWQGGIANLPYSCSFDKELKELIRNRDNYQCQLCGMHESENIIKLAAHHIDYDKKNSNPRNLISLCKSCHMKTNHNGLKWKTYFSKKIEEIMNSKTMRLKNVKEQHFINE